MKTSLELAGTQAIEMTRRNQAKREFIFRAAMQSNAAVEKDKEAHAKEQKAIAKRFIKNMAIAWAGIIIFVGIMTVL